MLTASGKFQEAQKVLFNKAMKASYKLYKEVNSLSPNVNTVLHLFDHTICPIWYMDVKTGAHYQHIKLTITTLVYLKHSKIGTLRS